MKEYLVAYIGSAVVFLGLDFLWLTIANARFYRADFRGYSSR